MSWKRPDKRRVRAIRDRLREMYGQPLNEPHGHPIAELIKTVLSQHTNDRNRDRSFAQLRERYPTWEEVRDAPLDELEEAIRPGGLAQSEGADDPGDPGAARRASRSRLDRASYAARGVARVPPLAARRGAQNGGLRADLHLGHPGDPRRRPRPPRRRPPRALPGEGLVRARARRDAGDRPARGRLRAAHEPDPARPRGLPAETAMRRVRAAPYVPWYRAGRK